MNNINEVLDSLKLDNHLTIDDVPNIDLYMDQVIQLFEKTYKDTKRNEEDKVLTKTMINNYAKGKLFFPITNKKYSKDHLLLISLIYQLKGALSINDIKTVLKGINHKIVKEDFDIDSFYNSYLTLSEKNLKTFKQTVFENTEAVKEEILELKDEDKSYLEQALLVASLVNMSNFYRRTAEKIVDQISYAKGKEKDK